MSVAAKKDGKASVDELGSMLALIEDAVELEELSDNGLALW